MILTPEQHQILHSIPQEERGPWVAHAIKEGRIKFKDVEAMPKLHPHHNQLGVMLDMQEHTNSVTDLKWREKGLRPWYTAAWLEAAEMLGHLDWKWWKHTPVDMRQARMELVDIWHFYLSDLLTNQKPLEKCDTASFELLSPHEFSRETQALIDAHAQNHVVHMELAKCSVEDLEPIQVVENFIIDTLLTKRISIRNMSRMFVLVDMDLDTLYGLYIGKGVMNRFRQAHGYKDGTYRKHWWDGREDNEHLYDILDGLDITKQWCPEEVLNKELLEAYNRNGPV